VHSATETIRIEATAAQTWRILSSLHRLPEWYVPAQSIKIITAGPVRENWQFILAVRTLSGLTLKALGTVNEFDPQRRLISWRGQATGISGDSRWQVRATEQGITQVDHTFQGSGWLMFLSHVSGRNQKTVRKRLANLKGLIESEAGHQL
jgi:uncharacterized membrane protein